MPRCGERRLSRKDEPRILTEDVRAILRYAINPDNPDFGEAVQEFSERAGRSTRTIYRVLVGKAGRSTTPASLPLDTADRLVTTAGRHLGECRVLTPAGDVVDYWDA